MTDDPFRPIDPKTLEERATSSIRQAILRGDLLPGEQVNQAQIAEKLGISRGPVREALRVLEQEGLIRNVPYKGTFVTEITPAYIEELYSIRRVLEVFAVRRAIERAEPEDLERLRTTLDEMRQAADIGDLARVGELDLQFHYLICRSAHHDLLTQMWKSIATGVRRCLTLLYPSHEDPRDTVSTHPDVLRAIEVGDANRASELLDIHIREAGEQLYRMCVRVQAGDHEGV